MAKCSKCNKDLSLWDVGGTCRDCIGKTINRNEPWRRHNRDKTPYRDSNGRLRDSDGHLVTEEKSMSLAREILEGWGEDDRKDALKSLSKHGWKKRELSGVSKEYLDLDIYDHPKHPQEAIHIDHKSNKVAHYHAKKNSWEPVRATNLNATQLPSYLKDYHSKKE